MAIPPSFYFLLSVSILLLSIVSAEVFFQERFEEPVMQPHESRLVREWKSVERFTVSSEKAPSASNMVSIQKGLGLQLKEIPNGEPVGRMRGRHVGGWRRETLFLFPSPPHVSPPDSSNRRSGSLNLIV